VLKTQICFIRLAQL